MSKVKNSPMKGIVPKEFTLGGQKYTVEYVSNLSNSKRMGWSDMTSLEVKIDTMYEGRKIEKATFPNTFYHELVHQILDNMGEFKLSSSEKFVSCFSTLLSEAIQSCTAGK